MTIWSNLIDNSGLNFLHFLLILYLSENVVENSVWSQLAMIKVGSTRFQCSRARLENLIAFEAALLCAELLEWAVVGVLGGGIWGWLHWLRSTRFSFPCDIRYLWISPTLLILVVILTILVFFLFLAKTIGFQNYSEQLFNFLKLAIGAKFVKNFAGSAFLF